VGDDTDRRRRQRRIHRRRVGNEPAVDLTGPGSHAGIGADRPQRLEQAPPKLGGSFALTGHRLEAQPLQRRPDDPPHPFLVPGAGRLVDEPVERGQRPGHPLPDRKVGL
jgi:hypothetical protein